MRGRELEEVGGDCACDLEGARKEIVFRNERCVYRREETEWVTGLQGPSLAAVGCRAGIDAPIGFIFVQVKQEKASVITVLFVCHSVTSDV